MGRGRGTRCLLRRRCGAWSMTATAAATPPYTLPTRRIDDKETPKPALLVSRREGEREEWYLEREAGGERVHDHRVLPLRLRVRSAQSDIPTNGRRGSSDRQRRRDHHRRSVPAQFPGKGASPLRYHIDGEQDSGRGFASGEDRLCFMQPVIHAPDFVHGRRGRQRNPSRLFPTIR